MKRAAAFSPAAAQAASGTAASGCAALGAALSGPRRQFPRFSQSRSLADALSVSRELLQASSAAIWLADGDDRAASITRQIACGLERAGSGAAPAPRLDLNCLEPLEPYQPVAIAVSDPGVPRRASGWEEYLSKLSAGGGRTLVVMPFADADRRVGGMVSYVFVARRRFSGAKLRVVRALCRQIVAFTAQERRIDDACAAAVREERKRIARDLHDVTAQTLTGVLLHLGVIQRSCDAGDAPSEQADAVRTATELTKECIQEARRLVWQLRSEAGAQSLEHALRRLIRQMTSAGSVKIDLEFHWPGSELNPELKEMFWRVGQEALTNAVKHSGATHVRIAVSSDQAEARIRVQDNGVGFDPAEATRGSGLRGLRERAGAFGATLEIAGGPGRGAAIALSAPLKHRQTGAVRSAA